METLLTLSEPWHAAMPESSPSSSNMTQYLSLWLELGEFSVPVTRRVQTCALRTGQWMSSLAGPSYPRAVAMLFAQRYVFSNHGRRRRIHDNVCLPLSEGGRVLGQLLLPALLPQQHSRGALPERQFAELGARVPRITQDPGISLNQVGVVGR